MNKEVKSLQFDYKPNNKEEKKEINNVLMQVNDLLEYRDKVIDAFKYGTFLSENLKKESGDALISFVLEMQIGFLRKLNQC